jgi:hypothetical protein
MGKRSKYRGRVKGSKNKPKPLPPQSAEQSRAAAAASLQALLAVETDPDKACRLYDRIQKALAVPRRAGNSPDSYHGRREAEAAAREQKRKDDRTRGLAASWEQRNRSLPVPIVEPVTATPATPATAPEPAPPAVATYAFDGKDVLDEQSKAIIDRVQARLKEDLNVGTADFNIGDDRAFSVTTLHESSAEGHFEGGKAPSPWRRSF